jgi:outer membrane protein OmpA-like peptidoglycan-associated protein
VLPESFALCDQVAAVLRAHPELSIVRIEGHTDDTGDHLDNITLSRRRAEAVRAQLVARRVDGARLETVGFGAARPLVEGNDAAARAQNRRVEFTIVAVTPVVAVPVSPDSPVSPGTTP